MYIVRSDNGVLITRISDVAGKTLIMNSKGHFDESIKEKTSNGYEYPKRYILDEDMTYSPVMIPQSDFYTIIYLWKGYYLYPEN